MPRYMPIVLLMFALFYGCSGPKTDSESTASQQVQHGGDMIAAAQVYYNTRNHPITLQSLKQHLEAKLGGMSELRPGPSKGWAEMIRKVYEVGPMLCPRCGGKMRVIAFLTGYSAVNCCKGPCSTNTAKKEILIFS